MLGLNNDLLLRAKWQHLLDLPVTGDFVEDITIQRQGNQVQLLHQGKIIAYTNHVIGASQIERDYETLTGKTLTYSQLEQLNQGLLRETPYTKENSNWLINPNISWRLIVDILREKGINYEYNGE